MSLIIDLILILVAAGAIYLGISRGFIRSVMHFSSLIIAIGAVYFLTQPLSLWINENFVAGKISKEVESSISAIVSAGEEKLQLDMVLDERPEALTKIAERFSINLDEIQQYYSDALSSFADSIAIENISEKIASPTAEAISNIIAAVVIFALALIVLKFIVFLLELLCHIPILKHLNKFLGFIFGIASAFVSLFIVANLSVGLIHALESMNDGLFNQSVIDGSFVLRFLYSCNLIL